MSPADLERVQVGGRRRFLWGRLPATIDFVKDLQSFVSNSYSQHGEDGILAELFSRLGTQHGYFVEFGAWDGKHLSNCYALLERGWRGCYVEGDPDRFNDLVASIQDPEVKRICRFVAPDGEDSLDQILDTAGAPSIVDLLSIDVDGDDLAIWRGLQRYRARCVVIEYNPTIPFDTRFENPLGRNWGNSARSIMELATEMGYKLVAYTNTNLILVAADVLATCAAVDPIDLLDVPPGDRYFWAYDGSLLTAPRGGRGVADPEIFRIPWAGVVAKQPIHRRLRGYHDEASAKTRLRATQALAAVVLTRPVTLARRLRERRLVGR